MTDAATRLIGESGELTIRPICPAHIEDAVTHVYLPAFMSNPAYNMCFTGVADEDIPRALEWLFRKRLQLLLDGGATGVGAFDATGRVRACVCGVQPGNRPGLWSQIRAGLLTWPYRWGMASFLSVLDADNRAGSAPPDAYEVSMMAVQPSLQGRGVGSALIRHLMAEFTAHARRVGKSATVYLNTQKAINVTFYQRAGFRLIDVRRIHPVTGRVEVLPLPDADAVPATAARVTGLSATKPHDGTATSSLRERKQAAEVGGASSSSAVAAAAPTLDRTAPFLSWTLTSKV